MYKIKIKKSSILILSSLLFVALFHNVNTYAKTSKNNPYTLKSESFKNNINGFFTPNTWYRPKMINENGTHWRNSNSNDFRPLLSTWWPNLETKINYIYFMKFNGLGKGLDKSKEYNKETSKDDFDFAINLIQKNIKKNITKNKNTNKIQKLMNKFIKIQNQWNINSESAISNPSFQEGLQGGYFKYNNNSLTNYANSKYRLLNRIGENQNGSGMTSMGEFLLANDIDNSNPTVQSEQLNLLHYMMNIGSITSNDKNGNFDGMRFDATGSLDNDLLDLSESYFKNVLKSDKNEKNADNHLKIFEQSKITKKDKNRLTLNVAYSDLTKAPEKRNDTLNDLKSSKFTDKTYSYINNHDTNVLNSFFISYFPKNANQPKSVIKNFINNKFSEYYNDVKTTDKKEAQYNVPAMYAWMLSQKHSTPRVFYGDLYSEVKGFMKEKSPYYSAITNLMETRKKYSSGSENKVIKYSSNKTNTNSSENGILENIRSGNKRTEGLAVLNGSNPNLSLKDSDKIKVSMGNKHKNQYFRPSLISNNQGIDTFSNDKSANKLNKKTDSNGDFYLTKNEIYGVSNPQVSGYLSVWVPVGAPKNQDSRYKAKSSNKKISNNVLNSNIIFEGFSNYQTIEKKPNTYKKIAKNAKLFNKLGITYYEFPPAYRSSNGNSFQDETFQNGYAIKDRYDFGYKKPTKYGTTKELVKAIKALHKHNVKAMADYVPNQVYKLPKQEVVSATRTDIFGNYYGNDSMKNRLYAPYTKGSGKDYQAEYGGKYLKELKKKYPDIFNQKQVSTRKTIDKSNKKIKTWSAKYINGTNLQNIGSKYVLQNDNNNKYYKFGKDQYLPNNFQK